MADKIEADYEALRQVYQRLTQLTDDVETIGKHIGTKTLNLRDEGWQGQGSDAFYEEMNSEVAPAIRKLRQSLERATQVIDDIARVLREAEEEARTGFEAVMQ